MLNIEDVKKNLVNIVENLANHENEEEWFEFKENWYEPAELGQYISAMSNAAAMCGQDYAFFVWGIKNIGHDIMGTKFNYHIDVKNEPLQHYLARQISPDLAFTFDEAIIRKNRVVVLIIPAAKKVPTAFDGKRYIRIGSSKENLMKYPDRESQLFNVLRNGFPSVNNTESEYQDLTFNKLFTYYESKGISLNKRTFKKNLGFLMDNGRYNLLAQLLSDDSHFTIRFALFSGSDKTSTMYSVREFGNTCLLYSLDDVLRYGDVLNIPQADERNRIVERKEVPLFDAKAYSEAVINAFVHNKWIDGNGPMFTGFKDRIEILSRGTLPPKQTVDGFYAGESIPVNEALSKIFIQLHITEHTGRGIPQIVGVYGKETIKIKENNIVITIPYEKIDTSTDVSTGVANTHDNKKITHDEGKITHDEQQITHDEQQITHDEGKITHDSTYDDLKEMPIREKILVFCKEPRNINDIVGHLGYKERKTVRKYLSQLLEIGRIAMTLPDKPKSKNQKYVTIK